MTFSGKFIYPVISLLLIFTLLTAFKQQVKAVPSQFKQSIVPLECYIDAVNSGNESHLYITPEDCLDDKAADTIKNNAAQDLLISQLKEYGQEAPNQQIDASPKSREFEPKKGNSKFGIIDNLRTDDFVSFLLVISLVIPVTAGLYLFLRTKRSTLN